MASIKKKTFNPSARYNISLKRDTRGTVETYVRFLRETHKLDYTSSEIIEQMIQSFAEQDKEFDKFKAALTDAVKADIENKVSAQEKD